MSLLVNATTEEELNVDQKTEALSQYAESSAFLGSENYGSTYKHEQGEEINCTEYASTPSQECNL